MTRWEYQAIIADQVRLPSEGLNALGADGWECFAVTWVGGVLNCWLKRPLPTAAPHGLTGRLAAAGYHGTEAGE